MANELNETKLLKRNRSDATEFYIASLKKEHFLAQCKKVFNVPTSVSEANADMPSKNVIYRYY